MFLKSNLFFCLKIAPKYCQSGSSVDSFMIKKNIVFYYFDILKFKKMSKIPLGRSKSIIFNIQLIKIMALLTIIRFLNSVSYNNVVLLI